MREMAGSCLQESIDAFAVVEANRAQGEHQEVKGPPSQPEKKMKWRNSDRDLDVRDREKRSAM